MSIFVTHEFFAADKGFDEIRLTLYGDIHIHAAYCLFWMKRVHTITLPKGRPLNRAAAVTSILSISIIRCDDRELLAFARRRLLCDGSVLGNPSYHPPTYNIVVLFPASRRSVLLQ